MNKDDLNIDKKKNRSLKNNHGKYKYKILIQNTNTNLIYFQNYLLRDLRRSRKLFKLSKIKNQYIFDIIFRGKCSLSLNWKLCFLTEL